MTAKTKRRKPGGRVTAPGTWSVATPPRGAVRPPGPTVRAPSDDATRAGGILPLACREAPGGMLSKASQKATGHCTSSPAIIPPPGMDRPDALFTYYAAAFSGDECDAILRVAPPPSDPDQRTATCHVSVVPLGGAPWLGGRLMRLMRDANDFWWNFPGDRLEPPMMNEYQVGDEYRLHTDRYPGSGHRWLTVLLFLDDPATYDGGLFQMHFQGTPTTYPGGRGDVLVMPAWTLHRVTPVKSGVRRTVVAWLTE